MRVLDLCSGLGGFSEAFARAGDDVMRIELDPKFAKKVPHTITANVLEWRPPSGWCPEVVVASPPCEAFSIARYPYEKKHGRHPLYDHFVRVARECLDHSRRYPDAVVVVENPLGRLRHEIGLPLETIDLCMYGKEARKRTDLWGNYTRWGSLKRMCEHSPHVGHIGSFGEFGSYHAQQKANGGWGRSLLDIQSKAERARMPFELSQAVRDIALSRGFS